jgi:hypothetical protein
MVFLFCLTFVLSQVRRKNNNAPNLGHPAGVIDMFSKH